MAGHEPLCISVVLCDQVIEDKTTQNKSYIGTFNRILVLKTPAIHPRFSIVVSVTDGVGPHPVKVEILRDDQEKGEVCDFQISAKLHLKDPLDVTDIVLNVVNYQIRGLGRHVIRVTLGESMAIYQRSFLVVKRDSQTPISGPSDLITGDPPEM